MSVNPSISASPNLTNSTVDQYDYLEYTSQIDQDDYNTAVNHNNKSRAALGISGLRSDTDSIIRDDDTLSITNLSINDYNSTINTNDTHMHGVVTF